MDIVQAEKIYVQRMCSKNWSEDTIKNYRSQLRCFLREFKSRDRARNITANEIEQYLLTKVQINTRKHSRCAIQAFYSLVVQQPMKLAHIPWPKKERKLPQPIDAGDIQKIISVCHNLKHKAIICLLYGCGLRIGEVLNLKPQHIDSRLDLLRNYFKAYKPQEYLFNGQFSNQYSERSINEFLKKYAALAGVNQNIHAHLLRHSFATHALESGTDISLIQKLLGHNNIKTTLIYTHVSSNIIARTVSPLSNIRL